MEHAPKLLKIPKSECPDIWIHLPRQKMAQIMVQYGRPRPYSRKESVRSSSGRTFFWEREFEKILLKYGREKVSNWECLFVHRVKGLFLSVCVDDIKLAGKKQNIDPMWKVRSKEVDLGEPTSFFDHVYLGCTQRRCEISKDIIDNYTTMFESRISAGATENYPCSENAKKCVERYCELANKTAHQRYKYLLHALMTIISKKNTSNL